MSLAPSPLQVLSNPGMPRRWRRRVNRAQAAYVGASAGPGTSGPARTRPEGKVGALAMTGAPERRTRAGRAVARVALVARRVGRSPLARRLGGAVVLGILVWRLGVGPSLRAVAAIDGWSLSAAVALAALTTVCCAWRWRLVAAGLGAALPLRTAVAACYRSQFLNTATPGGVLGDVHRGVRHGRQQGDTAKGVRSVVWERGAGQVVQTLMALAALSVLPSPVRTHMPWVWGAAAAGLLCLLLTRRGPRPAATVGATSPAAHPTARAGSARSVARAMVAELSEGVLSRRTWPLVAMASALAVMGHVLTFLVAAHTAGATAPATQLVPLAFIVLLSMGVPLNLAGWGPREGVAAWAFGAAGLGADAGLSTAVVYGVLVLVASLPGAGVMLASQLRRRRRVTEGRRG
jgi:glycosyltransferase 2 family protein